MAVANGYGKVVTSGSVFMYDIGDVVNSYKGEPTTNLISNASTMSSWTNYYRTTASSTFTTEFGTTGYRFVNQPSWNGIYRNFNLSNTGTYTFSAWFRYNGGSSNNNGATVYISNYGGGDTVVGLDKSLIGVWQRVSHTISVSSPSNVYFYLISYGGVDSGTGNPDYSSWEVTMPQIELNSHATPFINGTRSATQGLLPLVGNAALDLTNVSFDSNARMYFDGTNDYIPLSTNIQSGYTQATYEFVCRPTSLPSSGYNQLYIQENSTWIGLYTPAGTTAFGIDLGNGSGWFDNNGGFNTGAKTTSTIYVNTYYHVVYSWDGSSVSVYLNGNLQSTASTLQASNGRQNVTTLGAGTTNRGIGSRYAGSANNWVGSIDVIKFYNRALTAAEVKQNYNKYKTRFNLS